MIFTAEQTRLIRRGKLTLAILPGTTNATAGTLRALRRRTIDENDVASTSTVTETAIDGDRVPVSLTILTVTPHVRISDVSLAQAKSAGFETAAAFRDSWGNTKARSIPIHATLVAFAVGDLRDAPRLLSARIGRQDYTTNPALAARGEPEAITDDQQRELHRHSAARDDQRRRQPLATHAHNVARELDEIRNRMQDEGLSDRSTNKTLRAIEYHVRELNRKVG